MGLLRFAIKCSIAGGAFYYTYQEGLWSGAEKSGEFYNKLYKSVSPLIIENVPQEVIQEIHTIPGPSDLGRTMGCYWNKGVTSSVDFLCNLPNYTSNGIKWIQQEIEKSSLTTSDSLKSVESK